MVDKPQILDVLWPDTYVEEANLSVQIAAIRKALGGASDTFIETIAKRGYRFVAPVEPVVSVEREQPASAGAYVFYVRANQLAYETTQLTQARDLYEATLRQDPNFAPAWARLGRCYRVIGKFGPRGDDAQASFAQAKRALKGEYQKALSETFGDIGYMPGLALASSGHTRDAIAALKWRERESADLKTAAYITSLRTLLEGKHDESVAALDQAATLQLDGEAMYYIARSYAKLGLQDRFIAAMTRVVDAGFFCSDTFTADPWLEGARAGARVESLLARAREEMLRAKTAFEHARGAQLLSAVG